MHQPPGVVWRLARTRYQGRALLLFGALVVLVHGAWWLQSVALGAVHLWASTIAVAALLYAWLDWRRSPEGLIQWDGQAWFWSGPSGVVQDVVPVVAMDFQTLMLLRLDARDHGRCWYWVVRAQDPVSWQALRRALFAGTAVGAEKVRAITPVSTLV